MTGLEPLRGRKPWTGLVLGRLLLNVHFTAHNYIIFCFFYIIVYYTLKIRDKPYLHFSFHVALAVSFWTESGMECWVERHTTAPSPQVHWANIPVEVPWLLNVTWLTCLFLILMATVIMVVSVVGIFFVTPWLPILREYGFQHWKHRLKGKPREPHVLLWLL